jgi:hypothetical protein
VRLGFFNKKARVDENEEDDEEEAGQWRTIEDVQADLIALDIGVEDWRLAADDGCPGGVLGGEVYGEDDASAAVDTLVGGENDFHLGQVLLVGEGDSDLVLRERAIAGVLELLQDHLVQARLCGHLFFLFFQVQQLSEERRPV